MNRILTKGLSHTGGCTCRFPFIRYSRNATIERTQTVVKFQLRSFSHIGPIYQKPHIQRISLEDLQNEEEKILSEEKRKKDIKKKKSGSTNDDGNDEKLIDRGAKTTKNSYPRLLERIIELKENYKDHVLLTQVGSFYEVCVYIVFYFFIILNNMINILFSYIFKKQRNFLKN